MGCSITVVKYIVFFFNLVFAVAGVTLLGVGISLKLKNDDIENFIPDKYPLGLPPVLLIIIGSTIFFTAFFGCCVAIMENTCMLTTFAVILLTLLIVQVAIGAYASLVFRDTEDLKISVKQIVEKSFNDYNDILVRAEFDFLQEFLECCGVDDPSDWKWVGGRLPKSCCSSKKNCTISSNDCYRKGCAISSYEWFKHGLYLLVILAMAIANIELVLAILGLCLSGLIKNSVEYRYGSTIVFSPKNRCNSKLLRWR